MATIPWNAVEDRTIAVEEYLLTSYRPDCDFVDGVVEERNLGEYEHGRIQTRLAVLLGSRELDWGVETVVEVRLQVSTSRFRVPDLMVLNAGQKAKRIVREAPLLCIEVLSPEDSWTKMRARLNDYLAMGVKHLWCFDPEAREVRRYTAEGFIVVNEPEITVPNSPIHIVLAEVFAVLD